VEISVMHDLDEVLGVCGMLTIDEDESYGYTAVVVPMRVDASRYFVGSEDARG
jgi:hypothetical protein